MEEQWQAARAKLRRLKKEQPGYTKKQLAQAIGRSVSWVKKWLKRTGAAPPDDERVLLSQSRARKQPPQPKTKHPVLLARILDIRDHPPDNLRRTPGPRAILYYLKKDKVLAAEGIKPPNSTSLVWQVLEANQRITRATGRVSQPLERPQPMQEIQMDFKDVTTVVVEPGGKKQHVVETFNFLDVGSSSLLAAFVREDFNGQTVVTTIGNFIRRFGVPHKLTFDRDVRFVGSAGGRDFPSALVRTLLCVGTATNICPPHRPDLNPYVERYHRSYGQECIRVLGPKDVGQTREVTEQYQHHYNYERPHQGLSCGNLPPRVAYPELPPLPGVPLWVNPDKWLYAVDGLRFIRKVKSDGMVEVDKRSYGVGRAWAGWYVSLLVDAPSKSFIVMQHQPQAKDQLTALARRHRRLLRAKGAAVVATEAEEAAGSLETLPKKKRPLLLELKAAVLEAEARPPLPGELMRLPIKGLHNGAELPFDEFIALMEQEALSEQRRYELARQQRLQKTG